MGSLLTDRRFLVVLASSLLLAAVVSAGFYRLVGSARAQAGVEWKDVVVAAQALPIGTVVRPEMVRLRKAPAAGYPKDGFARIEDVVDRAVLGGILADEPIMEARLAARGAGFGLSPLIPAGMRAVSVRVNDVVGVAGFVQPGARVDVLVTGRPPQGEESVTATVLQDVAVLSAGQTLQPDPKGQAITAQLVTLLVNPTDAEVLTLAHAEGRIQLVLRNGGDRGAARTPGSRLGALYRGGAAAPTPAEAAKRPTPSRAERPVEPHAPAPVSASPASYRVVVMNGPKTTVATFAASTDPDARDN